MDTPTLHKLLWMPLWFIHLFVRAWVRHGPETLGGWEGMAKEDICARITSISAIDWMHNPEGCNDRIDRHVWGKTVAVSVVVTVLLAYNILPFLLHRASPAHGQRLMIAAETPPATFRRF